MSTASEQIPPGPIRDAIVVGIDERFRGPNDVTYYPEANDDVACIADSRQLHVIPMRRPDSYMYYAPMMAAIREWVYDLPTALLAHYMQDTERTSVDERVIYTLEMCANPRSSHQREVAFFFEGDRLVSIAFGSKHDVHYVQRQHEPGYVMQCRRSSPDMFWLKTPIIEVKQYFEEILVRTLQIWRAPTFPGSQPFGIETLGEVMKPCYQNLVIYDWNSLVRGEAISTATKRKSSAITE